MAHVAATGLVLLTACGGGPVDSFEGGFPLRTEAAREFADFRPFDARLPGGRYRPCVRPTTAQLLEPARCAAALDDATLTRAAALSVRVARELDRGAATDALWAAAILDLVAGVDSGPALTRAIGRLHEVVSRDTSNATALNDAGVAHFVRMAGEQRPDDLLEAIGFGWRAVRADSGSALARFNLAVYLDRLHLVGRAAASWAWAARAEPGPGWADEAKSREAALRELVARPSPRAQLAEATNSGEEALRYRAIGSDDPRALEGHVLDVLLPAWATALTAGDGPRVTRAFDSIQRAAEALGATGDSVISWLAVSLNAADSATRREAAAAFEDFALGQSLYEQERYRDAGVPYARTQRTLDRLARAKGADLGFAVARDLMADRPAQIATVASRFAAADSVYQALLIRATGRPGAARQIGEARWSLAVLEGRQGRVGRSVEEYEAAAAAFAAARDGVSYGAVRTQVAEVYDLTGRYAEALRAALEGLGALRSRQQSGALQLALFAIGSSLERMGAVGPAIELDRELIEVATRRGRASDRAEAESRLARALARSDQAHEAEVAIRAARTAIAEVTDPVIRPRMDADINETEGDLSRLARPDSAAALLSAAIDYYRANGLSIRLASPLRARAEAMLARGDTARAVADLSDAAAEIEREAAAPDQIAARAALLAARGGVYRDLVRINLARRDTAAAFRAGELARPGLLRRGEADPPDLAPNEAIVALTPLHDGLARWLVTRDGTRLFETRLPPGELHRQVARLESGLRSNADDRVTAAASTDLYRLLIEPLVPWLRGATRLRIVADGELRRVPFAGLQAPGSGRFLVEDFVLSMAVRVGGRRRRAGPLPPAPARELLIDGSSFDPKLFAGLAPLPYAAREVAGLHTVRPGARVLQGGAATAAELRRLFPLQRLIHFAGHARSVEGNPGQSHLVTAEAGGGIGANALTGDELLRLDLRRVELVVLSACGTVTFNEAGGLGGLSRAFLTAGAGAVVSGIWESDDRATADLMQRFFAELTTRDPAEALQQAQIRVLKDPLERGRSPGLWAVFRVEQ